MRTGWNLASTFGIDPARVLLFMVGGLPQDPAMPGETEGDIAQAANAKTICVANIAEVEIFAHGDVATGLPTPPELIAGSTWMGAGTAQKNCDQTMSTLMGLRLGHVHDDMMINMCADNTKLRARAVAMVQRIAQMTEAEAQTSLQAAGSSVECAILRLADAGDDAQALLHHHGGHLRATIYDIQDPAQGGVGLDRDPAETREFPQRFQRLRPGRYRGMGRDGHGTTAGRSRHRAASGQDRSHRR